jgi:hypothetical protein
MYVYKITGKAAEGRTKLYVAKDKADGITELFKTKPEADKFSNEYNVEKTRRAHNLPPTNKALKKYSANRQRFVRNAEAIQDQANIDKVRQQRTAKARIPQGRLRRCLEALPSDTLGNSRDKRNV